MRPPTLSLLTTSLLFATAYAGNITYDDTAPNFSWLGHVTAVSGNCHGCSTKLDADATYNGTWHDQSQFLGATDTRGGSFVFTGTDVYLFGIHAYNAEPSIVWTLHPEGLTSRTYYDSNVNEKIYHALFYSATELANGEHTLSWELEPNPQTTGGNGLQVVLLDYAVVTAPGVDQGTEAGTQPQTTGSGGGEADAGPGNAAAATPARTGHSLTSSTMASVSVHSESQS
ncbi:hypothetical protein MKEN_00992900 [Mycena kentingensis (nom. inval.)]|nr:hypothetical protein MKEN_00992900 [Mycena kentingensis (nom. inval.)]